MATIDPLTRMNPAAATFYEAVKVELARINDPRLDCTVDTRGGPYLTFGGVTVPFPTGNGIHHQREAMLEILMTCKSGDTLYSFIDIYNQGYHAGTQDEFFTRSD